MKVLRRAVALMVVTGALVVWMMIPAFAQDNGGQTPANQEPAVTVTTPAADDAPLDWTYRYMIPTALALGVVVIVITSGQYFTSVVRKRYRIVDE